MTDYQSGTRITDPEELRRILGMPTATPRESEVARNTGPLAQGNSILDAARRTLGIAVPGYAVADAVGTAAGEATSDFVASFDPVRWIAGAAGIALIIGGIIISVRS